MNEQTIEMQIHAKAQEALQSLNKLTSQLTGVEKKIDNVKTSIDKVSATKARNEINSLNGSIEKASKSMTKLRSLFTFVGVKGLTKTGLSWVNEAIDYTEQLNLFNVVFDNIEKDGKTMFSNLGKEAIKFQYKLNEAFGTNKTETLYMHGIFQSMGETVGIPEKYAAIMSETTTKLTYDLASLFNKSEKTTAEAIRAGVYAAQTKPLRAYGIDVTQTSMQPILESLGITDRSIKEMSQAEKEILRYLATLRQARIAMGDLANTIESPSNQMKIFRQQLVETKVAISSLFIGSFTNILPYANAFLMIVKEISKAIATMFGIELKDYNNGIANQEGIYDGITDSADDASKAVKELKRQTLGFDEIHNINENKGNENGVAGINGGIDQRLLDAIKGYDNGMESVRMKASKIRDDIMKWLGFTKEIDPLTGEVSFKYQGIKTTLKNMWNSFKGLSTQGKILVGLGLVAGATKLWNTSKKLTTSLGSGTGLLGTTKKLLSPMKSLYKSLDNVNYYNKSLTKGLSEGITNWSKSLTMADKFKVSLVGILGLSTSMSGMASAMKSVSNEGWNLGNSLQAVASGLGGIASGAYIGSIFGPWGAVIGAAAGAVLELVSACQGYQTETDKLIAQTSKSKEEMQKYVDKIKESKQEIENSMLSDLTISNHYKNLLDEMGKLVDANGKVKKGYEDRVNFILNELNTAYGTEYKLINGVITKNDEQVNSYKEVETSIHNIIKAKQAEIVLNAYEQEYNDALKRNLTNFAKKEEALKAVKNAQKLVNDKQAEWDHIVTTTPVNLLSVSMENYNTELQKLKDNLKIAEETYSGYADQYKDDSILIINYEQLKTDTLNKKYDSLQEKIIELTNVYERENNGQVENVKATTLELLKYYKEQGDLMLQTVKEKGGQISEELKGQAYFNYNTILNSLIEQSQTVDGMTDEVVGAWKYLAENSSSEFTKAFKDLPNNIQNELLPKLKLTGSTLGNALSSGIKFDGTNLFNGWNTSVTKLYNTASKITGGMFGFSLPSLSSLKIKAYANGGMPEDGLFFANHNELVGKFSNGRTAVANNTQIIEGIKAGVYEAVTMAMSQYGANGGIAEINVHADEGIIVETAINGINQKTRQTGVCPVDIPI